MQYEKHISETVPNGNIIKYKVLNGTAYHEETPDAVVSILEDALAHRRSTRLRFCFGDVETGRDWGEVHDTTGYLGRSTGSIKIPLLIVKVNDDGGGGLLDHCIVKIERKRKEDKAYSQVYIHPKYHKEE